MSSFISGLKFYYENCSFRKRKLPQFSFELFPFSQCHENKNIFTSENTRHSASRITFVLKTALIRL